MAAQDEWMGMWGVMGMEASPLLEVALADMEVRLLQVRNIPEQVVHQIVIEIQEVHHLTGKWEKLIINLSVDLEHNT